MIDFNKATRLPNKFLGSERKITVLYDGIVLCFALDEVAGYGS